MSDWLEATFVQQRPRAIAALTRYFRDTDIAEDAFAEACVKAITRWTETGAPRDPFAWLLTAAKNAGLDQVRKHARRQKILARYPVDSEQVKMTPPDPDELRDDVLRLLFICCHPALERRDQIALALKIVAGLTIPEIARGFLVKPKTMEQRLTRAKKKIAGTPVAFETPSPEERGRRLTDVSVMIYLMFNEGWSASGGAIQIRLPLCEEAIRLARLVVAFFPGMGEQISLLSLLLLQHARRDAREDAAGQLVTLEDQDRSKWDAGNIAEGCALLQKAQRINHAGPYLLQAVIAATHARAATADDTDWHVIEAHYAALWQLQPTPVVKLNYIAAQARTRGAAFALSEMNTVRAELAGYRWYHAMHGELLRQTGQFRTAIASFENALKLNPTTAEKYALREKINKCKNSSDVL